MHAMINPYVVFDLFCVCIDGGVRLSAGGVLVKVKVKIFHHLEGLRII